MDLGSCQIGSRFFVAARWAAIALGLWSLRSGTSVTALAFARVMWRLDGSESAVVRQEARNKEKERESYKASFFNPDEAVLFGSMQCGH